jgi:molybdenum cofactor biosynthesis enzyme MoaA
LIELATTHVPRQFPLFSRTVPRGGVAQTGTNPSPDFARFLAAAGSYQDARRVRPVLLQSIANRIRDCLKFAQAKSGSVPAASDSDASDAGVSIDNGDPAVRYLDLQLNTLCNADCFFCGAHSKEDHVAINFEQFRNLAKNVHLETVEEMVITGGEPTVNKDFEKILRHLHANYKNIGVRLITNAIHLPEPIIDAILLGNVISVHVSVNAASRTVYKDIAHVDKYEAVTRNISRLVEKRNANGAALPSVSGSLVLVKQNMGDVVRFAKTARQIGFDSLHVLRANLNQELRHHSAFENPRKIAKILQKASKAAAKKKMPLVLPAGGMNAAAIRKCTEPWNKIWVSARGDVNPCCGYDFRCSHDQQLRGNLLTQDLREFWYSGLYGSLRNGLTTSNFLPGCRACYKQIAVLTE